MSPPALLSFTSRTYTETRIDPDPAPTLQIYPLSHSQSIKISCNSAKSREIQPRAAARSATSTLVQQITTSSRARNPKKKNHDPDSESDELETISQLSQARVKPSNATQIARAHLKHIHHNPLATHHQFSRNNDKNKSYGTNSPDRI